jgi:branched chain amino acid efflux pump
VSWWAIAALALGTYAMKAAGPLVLGARRLPPLAERIAGLAAVALLCALIALQTFTDGGELVFDGPLVAGVAVAGVAVWRRAPFVAVVLAAAATTALLRLVT